MKSFLLAATVVISSLACASAATPPRHTTTMKAIDRHTPLPMRARAAAEAAAVPYECSLGKNKTDGYTVIDANADGRTWKPGGFTDYSVCMAPNVESVEAADDWLISPAIALDKGKYYTVSFDTDMTLNKTEDILEVFAGQGADVESLTERVSPEIRFAYNNKEFITREYTFSPQETGSYYFGFHCKSKRTDSGTPKLKDFKITEAEAPLIAPENAVEVPYECSLGKNMVNDYTVIDANNDEKTWKPGAFTGYSVCMKPTDEAIETADDWFISVPLHLFAGKDYCISIDEGRTLSSGSAERAEICIGTAPTVEAMAQTVMPLHEITSKDFVTSTSNFTVAAEGYYYIGIHCTSEKAKSGNYKACNLSVSETSIAKEPAAAGTLSYVIAPKGELKATLTYTAPTLTQSGNPLAEISKVVITTNWAYTTELTDVEPGKTYTVEVENLWQGSQNRFEAVAYVGDVAGESILITGIFAGEDTPLAPENLKIALSNDYRHVTLTWDAVGDTGENGGWVDTENMSYYIFDAFGSYYDPAIGVTDSTSFTIDFDDFEGQEFVAYQVTACVGEYNASLPVTSDIAVIGDPSALPFHESFSDCYYWQDWVVDPESTGYVMDGLFYDNELQTNIDAEEGTEPVYLNSQDGDNGFYLALTYEKDASHGFYSTKIDIRSASSPVFQLFYQGKGSILELKVGADGGEMEVAKSINLKEEPTDDWTLASVDLAPYKSARYIQVGIMIRGVHNTDTETWSVPVDNIRVIDQVARDMRTVVVDYPAEVNAGESATVSVTVENLGTEELSNVNLTLTSDGIEYDNTIATIPVYGTEKASFGISTDALSPDAIAFSVEVKADGITSNDANTAAGTFAVTFPKLPMPTDLVATPTAENIELQWTAPDYESLKQPVAVTEDFESAEYPVFTINDFGEWTLVDNDGKRTYTFMGDVNNPYRTQPQAFQLFDTKKSGMSPDSYIDAEPFSGERMLVAWSAQGQNDNWLISPALSGNEQTISFRAKSFTIAFPETFEVLFSTSGKALQDFVRIENVENYPEDDVVLEDWVEYKAALPEGARYFAIRHTAYDTYALYIDDIAFEAAGEAPSDLELLGYKPYVDGTAVCETIVATNVAVPFTESGKHSARVSAVYNYGESRACEAVEADVIVTGVANVTTATSISLVGRLLTVSGARGTAIDVFGADGKLIFQGSIKAEGNLTVELPSGICVVNAGGVTAKCIAF